MNEQGDMTCISCGVKMKKIKEERVDRNTQKNTEECWKCKATGEVTINLKKYGRVETATWKRPPEDK